MHTPFPWAIANGVNRFILGPTPGPKTPEEEDCNLQLLAALPDLLEACEAAYHRVANDPTQRLDPKVMILLRQAILKATGVDPGNIEGE